MQIMVSSRGVFSFVTIGISSVDGESEHARAHVPFDFVVGERVLHAGVYEIEESGTPGMIRFRSYTESRDEVLVQAINQGGAESTIPEKLLFLVQQNRYYLGQALMPPLVETGLAPSQTRQAASLR